MKRCPRCERTLAATSFGRNRARRDGRQSYCIPCQTLVQRASHERHAAARRMEARRRNAEARSRLREIIRETKDRPCADCGRRYPHYVMDLDHVDPRMKGFTVGARAVRRIVSVEALRAEIAKCQVVCANCHRERTFGSELGRKDSNLD